AYFDGRRVIILRWITDPTRQVHPASDCYRGVGFNVKWLPLIVDEKGCAWSRFEASKRTEKIVVRELIEDESGKSWSDPSSWYWAAVLGETRGPWWSITVEESQI
ncbi:MAG: hypothetical protein K2Z81_10310, partial [Cyanobacteria bacterium]|nr:hypothetical protein [Cyanobacteriota bacterium]